MLYGWLHDLGIASVLTSCDVALETANGDYSPLTFERLSIRLLYNECTYKLPLQ